MSSQALQMKRVLAAALLAALAVCPVCFSARGADSEKSKEKEKSKKDKGAKKESAEPKSGADLFIPTPGFLEAEKAAGVTAAQIEAEVKARVVPMPEGMDLEIDWYSPHVNAEKNGRIVKGWVIDDVILMETDKNHLLCVRRADGVSRWVCELPGPVRYAPAVSRINVLVNVNNHLIGIHKEGGQVRWKLLPNFVMSCTPLIVDPAVYPKEYTKLWQGMENIYVGGWDGRFHTVQVRGRLTSYVKDIRSEEFSAPDFDLYYPWHKTHAGRGIITTGIIMKDDLLYYAADDQHCYSVSREGVQREPYYMMGAPVTPPAVTSPVASNTTNSTLNSYYIGARDKFVYCLDRLTMKRKWTFAPGRQAVGTIVADDFATPYVYVATEDGVLHGLKLTPAYIPSGPSIPKGQPEVPEAFAPAWQVGAAGVIATSPDIVYAGLDRQADFPSFRGVAAVDKASGKVLWKYSGGGFFTSLLEYQNSWTRPGGDARIYALSSDNRLVSLKEKQRHMGIREFKPVVEPPPPVAPSKKKEAKEGAGEAPAAPPPADKKEAPKE